jgi:thioredoxin-dependent peroxiredoxin
MTTATIGKTIPSFELPATGGKTLGPGDFEGRKLVLYFYPKDDTPGCTIEGQGFRDHHEAFLESGAEIVGVSRDSIASHEKFRAKYQLPFDLISDSDEILCGMFNVMREKNMYGRKVMGVERSTFLIDAAGVLRREWRKVKVPGHVEEVLAAVKAL